ncbi:sodium-dependent transporter [Sesbania bispinosa]|nr:sodium-dependent transporter [Sesbania bispinosa]
MRERQHVAAMMSRSELLAATTALPTLSSTATPPCRILIQSTVPRTLPCRCACATPIYACCRAPTMANCGQRWSSHVKPVAAINAATTASTLIVCHCTVALFFPLRVGWLRPLALALFPLQCALCDCALIWEGGRERLKGTVNGLKKGVERKEQLMGEMREGVDKLSSAFLSKSQVVPVSIVKSYLKYKQQSFSVWLPNNSVEEWSLIWNEKRRNHVQLGIVGIIFQNPTLLKWVINCGFT